MQRRSDGISQLSGCYQPSAKRANKLFHVHMQDSRSSTINSRQRDVGHHGVIRTTHERYFVLAHLSGSRLNVGSTFDHIFTTEVVFMRLCNIATGNTYRRHIVSNMNIEVINEIYPACLVCWFPTVYHNFKLFSFLILVNVFIKESYPE